MATMDETPYDFVEQLERRLGVGPELAFSTLANWIEGYEPSARSRRLARATGLAPLEAGEGGTVA